MTNNVFDVPIEEAVIVEVSNRIEMHQLRIITKPRPRPEGPQAMQVQHDQAARAERGERVDLEVVPAKYIIDRARQIT